ncbi:MAG: L,D-transpeptidase [Thermodesulfovibrionales bacterium]|nr:L,D-transpeptidase [Thermodesulfovibrionales bacterium]
MRRYNEIFFLIIIIFLAGSSELSGDIYRSPCNIKYPSDSRIAWYCYMIKKGETLEGLFGDRWIDVARFNRIDRRHVYTGVSIKVPYNLDEIKNFSPMPEYYEPAKDEPKFILIDLSEQFLGAYEYGRIVFSAPAITGEKDNETPKGDFRIDAYNSRHRSSLYVIENTNIPYPMHYGLRFYVSKNGVGYWIHGRDMPGYPASHGCVGLYDEEMQKRYYKYPKDPVLQDAKRLFEWVISPIEDDGKFHFLKEGPRVRITGKTP